MFPLSSFSKTSNQTVVEQIPIKLLKACPYQPRKIMNKTALEKLTHSIKENGILQPLTATKLEDGTYQLIAGHRRMLAANYAGLLNVPVIIMNKQENEIAVLTIIENIQREDLNYFEEAMAIQTLISKLNLTQAQVGEKLSISQPAIANKLKLLQFSKSQQLKFLDANLTERHARAISRLQVEKQDKAIEYIIRNNLNVAQTDKYINDLLHPTKKLKKTTIIAIKDIRLFTNTLNKAVKIMQTAGFDTKIEQEDKDEYIQYYIRIPKNKQTAN